MEELQTELKAIQAALRSIRANEPRSSVAASTPVSAHAPTVLASLPPRMQQIKPLAERTHRTAGEELAMETQRLSRLTSASVKKLEQPKPHVVHSLDEAFQRLDAQAEAVNQLSAAQEAAILKLKAIAEQVGQDWQASDSASPTGAGKTVRLPPICEYLETSVPHIEKDQQGRFVVTSRSVDLFKAEREAELNAKDLRHRAIRTQQHSSFVSRFWNWLVKKPQSRSSQSKMIQSKMQKRSAQRSKSSPFNVRYTVVLIVGAIVTRILLDTLLAIFPGLWLPAIAIMVTPSAIALYRRPLTSESGLIWSYRLVLVIIGLLIGGRI